ncbi:MAG: cryptochrome/photolyase family protein [Bacteroidales bacterium]
MKYKKIALVPGDSLYPDVSALEPDKSTLFFMAEDKGLCTHFKYHKHKLVLFLSAMRSYADNLKKNYDVEYHKLEEDNFEKSYFDKLKQSVKKHEIKEITSYVIEDKFFRDQLIDFSKTLKIELSFNDSPGFMNTVDDFQEYLSGVKGPFMQNYYIRQRKKHNLLLEKGNKPMEGKWSFDKENRKKLPATIEIPSLPSPEPTKYTLEVIRVVNKFFPSHPGSTDDFIYATTREEAMKNLDNFLEKRFGSFGPYEDAINSKNVFLFHSVLSPYLNLGLLTPEEVIDKAISYGLNKNIHFPSIEGFVRQIAGWREFLRGMYHHFDMQDNFFHHKRKLTESWYKGETGIVPLDDMIKKVDKYAYAHHIERLMIAGNIMLLSEIHPDEVYKWFMEMFIDSADWVMVPNVYGMSQFADGGSFATKPYIAGSNYILKMSDYKKDDWCDTLDGLYWRFIDKKRDILLKNARMSIMIKSFDKMNEERKKKIIKRAEEFLESKTRLPG